MPSRNDILKKNRRLVDISKRWRRQEQYDAQWRTSRDFYKGKQAPKSNEDRIIVNLCKATVDVVKSSVAVNHPKSFVSARQPDDYPKAAIAEAVVDYWWRCRDIKPQFQAAVKDSLIFGHGWCKVTWKRKTQSQPVSQDDQQSQYDELTSQVNDYAQQNPDMANSLPTPQDVQDQIDTEKTVVTYDGPVVTRISPHDIFVDPEATCMDDVCWIAQRIVRPISDINKDSRYNPKVRSRIAADSGTNKEWLADDTKQYGREIQRGVVWEFYDLKANTVATFAESGDDFLIAPTDLPYAFGHPFVFLANYDIPDEFYPMGELDAIIPLQDELNKTRSQLMNARKQYSRKWLYREDAFDQQGKNALEDDRDNVMVPVNEGTYNLSEVIAPLPSHQMPPDLFNYSGVIQQDINTVSGVNEYARGNGPEIRRTATEANMIADAANARASDKLSQVEDFVARISERLVQLAQQFMTGEQMARVVGPNGPIWVPFKRDDIAAEFDFEVEGGSTMPHNEAFRKQQAMDLLQVAGPLMGTVLDPFKVLSWVFDQFGIRNPQQYMLPQMNPPRPMEKLIETINYKDAPPDVKREMEQQAGLQPSQMPVNSDPNVTQDPSQPSPDALLAALSGQGGAPAPAGSPSR